MENDDFEMKQQYYMAKAEKFKNARTTVKISECKRKHCNVQNVSGKNKKIQCKNEPNV